MQVKVSLYNEAERFASVCGKVPMIAIKEITLEPEDQYISIKVKYPIDECRELAALELSKHIINRLGYKLERSNEHKPTSYVFHIATLVEAEKLKFIKEIYNLNETIKVYETRYTSNVVVSIIKAEAKRYKDLYRDECSKSLWTLVKERLFK